ncbi:hypothetical protein EG328_003637 [Venturia inaequalis]|uniref:Uncharacterized protein n=1 Tax=Venturia inaequalis TaxID=5025 RepID=A0A8H3VHM6_VENIN|nr:hypothetical protein EG328_003637 [Venturia inaequalis]KAE9993086.1 hypothetical protein EG327_006616 [Venturia inaequalis]
MAKPTSISAAFELFTSLRYDPILRTSSKNSAFSDGVESPLYMRSLHQCRLLEAAQEFGFDCSDGLAFLGDGARFEKYIIQEVEQWGTERDENDTSSPLRVKFVFDRQGSKRVELSMVPKVSLEVLFPSTLDLPPEESTTEPPKTFEPSPLTGGALIMGPTDFQPVPNTQPHSTLTASYSILLDSQPTPVDSHTVYKTTHRPHYDSSRSRILGKAPHSTLAEEVLLYNPSSLIMEGSLTTPYFYRNGRWVTPPVWDDDHGGQRGTTRRYAIEQKLCKVETISIHSLQTGEKIRISNGTINKLPSSETTMQGGLFDICPTPLGPTTPRQQNAPRSKSYDEGKSTLPKQGEFGKKCNHAFTHTGQVKVYDKDRYFTKVPFEAGGGDGER